MNYDPAAIRAAIKSVLSGIVGSGQPVSFLYDYANPNPEGYPCIIITGPTDQSSIFLDNVTNQHSLTFKIYILQEVTAISGGQEAAQTSLDAVAKAAVPLLEQVTNMSLGGKAIWTTPTTGDQKQAQTENGPVLYKEISLSCQVLSAVQ